MKKLSLLSFIGLALSQLAFGHNGERELRNELSKLQHKLSLAQGLQNSMMQLKSVDHNFDENRCCIKGVMSGISNMKQRQATLTKTISELEHENWKQSRAMSLQRMIEVSEQKMHAAYKQGNEQKGNALKEDVAHMVKQLSSLLD